MEVVVSDIERIKESTEIQMTLSELLFKALDMEGCWHEWELLPYDIGYSASYYHCTECGLNIKGKRLLRPSSPNLFTRSAFLDVWDAVKDNHYPDFFMKFCEIKRHEEGDWKWVGMDEQLIATPYFQLEVLKWKIGANKVREVLDD
jgi:hypothetical protein